MYILIILKAPSVPVQLKLQIHGLYCVIKQSLKQCLSLPVFAFSDVKTS